MAYGAHVTRRGPKDDAVLMEEGESEPWEWAGAIREVIRRLKQQATLPWHVSMGSTSTMTSETNLGRSVDMGTMFPWSKQSRFNGAI